jgi:c-di-GMP-binding flagellar brake protein YcgR
MIDMSEESSYIERRRYKRFKVDFAVSCKTQELFKSRTIVEPKEVVAKMFDLSEGGAGFISDYGFSPNTNIEAKFTLVNLGAKESSRYSLMDIMGEVCYSFPFRENLNRVGISFKNVAPQERRAISSFVNSRLG